MRLVWIEQSEIGKEFYMLEGCQLTSIFSQVAERYGESRRTIVLDTTERCLVKRTAQMIGAYIEDHATRNPVLERLGLSLLQSLRAFASRNRFDGVV